MPTHSDKIQKLQEQIVTLRAHKSQLQEQSPVSLSYGGRKSFTIRSKAYKQNGRSLDCRNLDQILEIDTHKRLIRVEPRVTMEQLVGATFPLGLSPPVIPEVKSMTVGGAIMGIAGESSSYRWGSFNDSCTAFEMLNGNGDLLRASPTENEDLFSGFPGSYGSLGMLVAAEIPLVPIKEFVHLHYHLFSQPTAALETLSGLMRGSRRPDFLEGFIFSCSSAVIVEGTMSSKDDSPAGMEQFSCEPATADWFYQHVYKIALQGKDQQELMTYPEYLFRHDPGGFWIGALLCHGSFLTRFVIQGILKLSQGNPNGFSDAELHQYRDALMPNRFWKLLLQPWMNCKSLGNFLHSAENWFQDRFVIQDFCLPEVQAAAFLSEVIADPAIFPTWLCPLKSCCSGQIFAPHLKGQDGSEYVINIGLYGLPAYSAPIEVITRKLEHKVKALGGRKVLYSRSYYSEDEFWSIYSRPDYERLRQKTLAKGFWHEITDKVLSA